MKTIEETYRERLKMLIKEYGSQTALSIAIDKSPAQISQWLNASADSKTGKPRTLKSATAREIEAATGKPYGWFDQPTNAAEKMGNEIPEGFVRYDVLNITANLGGGITNPDCLEVVDTVTVAESWAKKNLGSNYRRMQVISTKGDSMKGTIEEGDVLFIDAEINYYAGEGIYIIHTPDGLRAKRLQLLLNGNLKIISDNRAYDTEIVSGQDLESVIICGKVKGRWALETF